jgi:3-deoxy-D-manno-octulosonic acid kinase
VTGAILSTPADLTAMIDRLEAVATRMRSTAPVGPSSFVWRPLTAVLRRLWLRRRDGIPGLILSIVETYGEILTAAQAWERHGIAARRAERESGVPPGFHIWRTPMGSLTLRDGTPPLLRKALLDATPDAVAGMPLAGGRGAVWAVSFGDHERGVLRWYRRGGIVRHLIHDRYFGWSPRPIRELALTEEAIRRGIPAPEVLAARVDRLPWGWYRGAIVTREVTGAATFAEELHRHPDGDTRTRLLVMVGRAIRDLHDCGIHHRDLNATNILVSRRGEAWQVHFIDFDRAEVHHRVASGTRRRELQRLERSLLKLARSGMPLGGDDALVLRRAYQDEGAPS